MDEFEEKLEEIRSLPLCEPCDGESCEYRVLCEFLRDAEKAQEGE